MSIAVMNLVWQNAPYQGNTLLALLALADWSDDDGVSWPGVETLARKSRQSGRNVQFALHKMASDGFIRITVRPHTSNIYRINIRKLEGVKGLHPQVKSLQDGVKSEAKNPAQISPYTSIEPSVDSYKGNSCFKCEGNKQVFNYGPGPRIIPCPECQPPAASA